jgi:hypothetical protein
MTLLLPWSLIVLELDWLGPQSFVMFSTTTFSLFFLHSNLQYFFPKKISSSFQVHDLSS